MSEQLSEAQSKYTTAVDDGKDEGNVTLTVGKPIKPYIVLSCDARYLCSFEGIFHLIELVVSMVALGFLVSSGTPQVPFLSLVLSWHSRIFLFVTVMAFLFTLTLFVLNVTTIIEAFAFNWPLLNLLVLGLLSFLYLFCSSLVASTVSYYQSLTEHVPRRTIHYLVVASVLGYVCFISYAISAISAFRLLTRSKQQFSAQHLRSAQMSPQISMEQQSRLSTS